MPIKKNSLPHDLIIHPGETIADVLKERGISQEVLAARTGVPLEHVSSVISGQKAISSDFATVLETALGVPKSFWLNLQANYNEESLANKG